MVEYLAMMHEDLSLILSTKRKKEGPLSHNYHSHFMIPQSSLESLELKEVHRICGCSIPEEHLYLSQVNVIILLRPCGQTQV